MPWNVYDARVHTRVHQAWGKLRLPPGVATADYLNLGERRFLPLEEARLYPAGFERAEGAPLFEAGFLALAKAQVLWIAGGPPAGLRASPRVVARRRLALFFADHLLVGEVETLRHLDPAAFLSRSGAFVTLHRAGLYPLEGFSEGRPPRETFDFLTVHLGGIEGVVELPSAGPGDRAGFY